MTSFLLFVVVAVALYGAANYYLYRRVVSAACLKGKSSRILRGSLILLALAYPLSRALGTSSGVGTICVWIGSIWVVVLAYGLAFTIIFDLIRMGDRLTGWLPAWVSSDNIQSGRLALSLAFVVILFFVLTGYIRGSYPVVTEHTIEVESFPEGREEYSIVAFSDVHLSRINRERMLDMVIRTANWTGADACFIIGDVISAKPELMDWIVEPLSQLDFSDGVYFATGNHEFYQGVGLASELLRKAGITVLRDSSIVVEGAFNLIGLDDLTGTTQLRLPKTPIVRLMSGNDPSLPTILLHHTPDRIEEAADAGVDLMLSGHTHGGQIWPANYLMRIRYGVKQGLSKFGEMYFYLTNGVGTFGPPVRIGAKPEIVNLTLVPSQKN
ncbi:MAG: metallophosphoesterase [Calditrichaeota bacterium]|nr:metallophosphoesterase [Calditrichota bacterium]MBT7618143.1 metallophosphoesterase [Calditrichota bacterium]MBT7787496.1 metallophosphoesterase [Calditrichota bacterium]